MASASAGASFYASVLCMIYRPEACHHHDFLTARVLRSLSREPIRNGWLDSRSTRRERRMHGTIARMAPEEGFGFIDGDDGHEYFFHRTALNATRFEDLAPGTPVQFRIGREEGDRPDEGQRAIFVRMA